MNIKAHIEKTEGLMTEDGKQKMAVVTGMVLSLQEYRALIGAMGEDGTVELSVKK